MIATIVDPSHAHSRCCFYFMSPLRVFRILTYESHSVHIDDVEGGGTLLNVFYFYKFLFLFEGSTP